MISGRLIPFKRTPKIANRTPTPVVYLLAIYGVFLFSLCCCIESVIRARYSHALFSVFNAGVVLYGCAVLIGFRASWDDLLAGVRSRAWWPPRLAFAVQVQRKFRVRSACTIADALTEPLTPRWAVRASPQ